MEQVSQYEVRCARCNVSFPPETRVCMHCGGRTGPSIVEVPDQQPAFGEGGGSGISLRPAGGDAGNPFVSELEVDDDNPRLASSLMRSAGTLIWVALAILFTLMRACGEN